MADGGPRILADVAAGKRLDLSVDGAGSRSPLWCALRRRGLLQKQDPCDHPKRCPGLPLIQHCPVTSSCRMLRISCRFACRALADRLTSAGQAYTNAGAFLQGGRLFLLCSAVCPACSRKPLACIGHIVRGSVHTPPYICKQSCCQCLPPPKLWETLASPGLFASLQLPHF